MKRYTVNRNSTLLESLKEHHPDSSITSLRQMLKQERVSIDQRVTVRANEELSLGQEVVIATTAQRTVGNHFTLLYEDRSIIVIDKSERVLSFPLDEEKSYNALELLQDHFHSDQIYAVHRLDRDSSGVMVFARGKRATLHLNELFREHDLSRQYIAIVQGHLKTDHGIWESFLQEVDNYRVVSTKDAHLGKKAITEYKVVKRSKNFSFLELTLQTGRKHQIRVQCADAGHPIVGDKRYGVRSCNPMHRMGLHATLLEFVHPISRKKMRFTAPIPTRFQQLGWPS